MIFARRVFLIAGIYGLLVLLPLYFLEARIGRDQPPAITHPEYFYGFLGVAVSWQVAFLVISRDPVRFRPLMVPAVLEKATFGLRRHRPVAGRPAGGPDAGRRPDRPDPRYPVRRRLPADGTEPGQPPLNDSQTVILDAPSISSNAKNHEESR